MEAGDSGEPSNIAQSQQNQPSELALAADGVELDLRQASLTERPGDSNISQAGASADVPGKGQGQDEDGICQQDSPATDAADAGPTSASNVGPEQTNQPPKLEIGEKNVYTTV